MDILYFQKRKFLELDGSFEDYFSRMMSGNEGMDEKIIAALFPSGTWKDAEPWKVERDGKSYSGSYRYIDHMQCNSIPC